MSSVLSQGTSFSFRVSLHEVPGSIDDLELADLGQEADDVDDVRVLEVDADERFGRARGGRAREGSVGGQGGCAHGQGQHEDGGEETHSKS